MKTRHFFRIWFKYDWTIPFPQENITISGKKDLIKLNLLNDSSNKVTNNLLFELKIAPKQFTENGMIS